MRQYGEPVTEGTSRAVLQAEGVSRSFGGVLAVNEVALELRHGEVHAVIGTNGAGKSTLANLLCGDLAASTGQIQLCGEDVTGLPAWRLSRLGVGRSYQQTNIFPSFSVFENARLAAQSRRPRSFSVWRRAEGFDDVNAMAREALAAVGLEARSDDMAEALSHGARRQLEIAMCLATQPQVLLLDEPLAGMGAAESAQIVALIRRLKPAHAILLIEHDMDAVFAVADRLTVMVNGKVVATGRPDAVRADPVVIQAYLGKGLSEESWHE